MFESETTQKFDTGAYARLDQAADLVTALHAACRLRTSGQLRMLHDQVLQLLLNRLVAEQLNTLEGR